MTDELKTENDPMEQDQANGEKDSRNTTEESNAQELGQDTIDKDFHTADAISEESSIEQPDSEPAPEPTPEEQIASLKDLLLRKAAEMDNMRKRQQKERIVVFEQAQAAAIEAFLPVNDDLLRTLQAIEPSEDTASIREGIELVAEKFQGVLQKYGVEAIKEKDVPFDVNLHEALLRQPGDEGVPSNQVLEVLENGYKLGERVIRHAKVIVSE